ncbi:MAG: hypothetical protein K0R82_3042 [Flavipsychrobacter sp.]|jgi:hypothetical protein|nr:hypothetical protein [Flavipsychrobacter sp.]
MKKLLLALLSVASITAANAQKNSILVFGTAAVEHRDQDAGANRDIELRSYHFMPGVGYQFHENMTAGLEGGFRYAAQEFEFDVIPGQRRSLLDDQFEWNLGAFYRYTHYFNQTFAVWGQFGLGYLNGDATTDILDTVGSTINIATLGDDYDGFRAYLTPAFAINVHNGWGLNFGFGGLEYRNISFDNGDTFGSSESSINFTLGQQINIGISKNINCKMRKRAPKEPGMDTRGEKPVQEDEDDEE